MSSGKDDALHVWLVIVLSLAAAFAFALSSSLKHVSAGHAPDAQNMNPSKLAGFVRATLSHPLWLAGIGCDAVGLGLQSSALHLGGLSVVQPLLVSGLVFALILRHARPGHQLNRPQLAWSLVLAGTLAGFLILATRGNATTSSDVDRLPAVVSGVIGLVLAASCVVLGRRQRTAGPTAALLGIAVGVIYAADAALLKGVSDIGVKHPSGVFTSWQLYTLVVLGAAGLFFNQLAFQAGPLVASLPATATVDPLLSIAVGVLVYDEHVQLGPGHGVVLVAMLLLLGIAVIKLARQS